MSQPIEQEPGSETQTGLHEGLYAFLYKRQAAGELYVAGQTPQERLGNTSKFTEYLDDFIIAPLSERPILNPDLLNTFTDSLIRSLPQEYASSVTHWNRSHPVNYHRWLIYPDIGFTKELGIAEESRVYQTKVDDSLSSPQEQQVINQIQARLKQQSKIHSMDIYFRIRVVPHALFGDYLVDLETAQYQGKKLRGPQSIHEEISMYALKELEDPVAYSARLREESALPTISVDKLRIIQSQIAGKRFTLVSYEEPPLHPEFPGITQALANGMRIEADDHHMKGKEVFVINPQTNEIVSYGVGTQVENALTQASAQYLYKIGEGGEPQERYYRRHPFYPDPSKLDQIVEDGSSECFIC